MRANWIIGLTGCALVSMILGMLMVHRTDKKQVFHLSAPPAFLDESLAVSLATEALENIEPDKGWTAKRYSPSQAPDGTADGALLRNKIDSNRGLVHFASASSKEEAIVIVELRGTKVLCWVKRPK
jgi:hypothetical protein